MVESLAPASGMGFLLALDQDAVLEQSAFGYDTGFQIAPEGDQQLARQGDDADFAHARAASGEARLVPSRQGTVRLEAQPGPSEFDGHPGHASVPGLVDAEFAAQLPALVGGGGEACQGPDLPAVAN